MRWEDGQVHMTSLETKEANEQECNEAKSVSNSTLSLSLGLLCAQADSGMHRCKKLWCYSHLGAHATDAILNRQ